MGTQCENIRQQYTTILQQCKIIGNTAKKTYEHNAQSYDNNADILNNKSKHSKGHICKHTHRKTLHNHISTLRNHITYCQKNHMQTIRLI